VTFARRWAFSPHFEGSLPEAGLVHPHALEPQLMIRPADQPSRCYLSFRSQASHSGAYFFVDLASLSLRFATSLFTCAVGVGALISLIRCTSAHRNRKVDLSFGFPRSPSILGLQFNDILHHLETSPNSRLLMLFIRI